MPPVTAITIAVTAKSQANNIPDREICSPVRFQVRAGKYESGSAKITTKVLGSQGVSLVVNRDTNARINATRRTWQSKRTIPLIRSEERRVGKECRARWRGE